MTTTGEIDLPKATLSNGLSVHYQQTGEGPDLVMIHGLTGNLAVWHLRIVPLLWDSFRVLTYDLRGHGYSGVTPSGYSPDEMAQDLGQLLDALEIQRAFLVGHSYGADIALYLAHNQPERVEGILAIEPALPAMIHARLDREWEGWTYWIEALERSGQHVPVERRRDPLYLIRASLALPKRWGPLNGLPRNPKRFLRLIDETTFVADTQVVGSLPLERIPSIDTHVVVVCSEGSAFLGTHDHLVAHLPSARSILLPRTEWGHFGPLEQPELVAEHILSTLAPSSP